jgi:thiamine-phosphate pyrophosphorylase
MADQTLPRLLIFSDLTRATRDAMLARFNTLAEAAQPRSVLFIVRDYTLSARARWALGVELAALARQTGQLFGVADRADLVRGLGAHALHLPEKGLSLEDARACVGADTFISRACHEPLRAAVVAADAVVLSPIFAPRKGRPALGLAGLERVRDARTKSQPTPALFALGAVAAENAAHCLAAGATGVAVIGAALEPDPAPLLKALEISRR